MPKVKASIRDVMVLLAQSITENAGEISIEGIP